LLFFVKKLFNLETAILRTIQRLCTMIQ